ncbi:MAG TPA: secretion protein HlyD, partial [Candidatus Glassbacteria bacterium]|nr:secretion protein HlyD [Candidatus Glassbacteria bacterium]
GQKAEVLVDAFPQEPGAGHITEIGNTAVVRSTGMAAGQSATSSQQAKDFKVVITLDSPHPELRPGLSATAEIVTASRENVLTVPLQALTVRSQQQLQSQGGAPKPSAAGDGQETEGVFVIRGRTAFFQPVGTGISGFSEVEILNGIEQGDEVVTGSYEALRSLQSGERVRIENGLSDGRSGSQ